MRWKGLVVPLYPRVTVIAIALAIVTLGAIRFAPRIEDVRIIAQTPNGSNIPLDTSITITFSRPVERRSAERALLFYPVIKGRFQWRDDQTVAFIPDTPLKPYTQYRVKVRIGLRDTRYHINQTETQL